MPIMGEPPLAREEAPASTTSHDPPKKKKPRRWSSTHRAAHQAAQRKRQQRESALRSAADEHAARGFPRVIRFKVWCRLVGVSEAVGRRLAAAGKVKITHLSPRAIGVRSDHHQQYLEGCLREQTS